MPRICSSWPIALGRRLATSTSAASDRTAGIGRSCVRAVSSRHSTSSRAIARSLGSSEFTRGRREKITAGSRSSVACASAKHSSRAQSRRPSAREAVLQHGRRLQQVADVVAGVVDLLGAQRPRVPAREARALGQPDAEQLVQQRLVAELRAQPGEAGGELRVEEVRDLRRPDAAQQRDVLAAGVHDDLDRPDRRAAAASGAGSSAPSSGSRTSMRTPSSDLDGDLHEAQQRAVAPLAHELRVDAEPPGLAREVGERWTSLEMARSLIVRRPYRPGQREWRGRGLRSWSCCSRSTSA